MKNGGYASGASVVIHLMVLRMQCEIETSVLFAFEKDTFVILKDFTII
jgi:hypothetical protein